MSPPRLELLAPSLAATHAVAAALAGTCRTGDVVLLAGEMGAGKTAFAQGFGRALGVAEPITSPTFTLVHTYETGRAGGPLLHHADLYRLDHLAEVADLALAELAEYDGIVLVEWGDVVGSTFGDHLLVHLAVDAEPVTSATQVGDVATPSRRSEPEHDGPSEHGGERSEPEDDVPARLLTLTPVGRTWAARWDRLVTACRAALAGFDADVGVRTVGEEPC